MTTALGLYLLLTLTATVRVRAEAQRAVRVSLEVRRFFVPEVILAAVLFTLARSVLCWVGLARVYTGVHYPGDILAGALCGFAGSVFAVAARPLVAPLLLATFRIAERARLT